MNKPTYYFLIFFGLIMLSGFNPTVKQEDPIEKRVDSLIRIMTIDEKIGQMTQMCFSTITLDGTKTLDLNAEVFRDAILKHHIGSFLSGTGPKDKWIKFVTAVQKIAIDESRLKIPLVLGIDHVHGANYVNEGTIFPHNLTLSCSFDPALMKEGAEVVAKETAPLGLSWNFAPVLDIGKNPLWPRLYETFGEDPLVCGVMGSAFIEGYQNCEAVKPYVLSACAKHFVGYSDPKSGWDRTPSEIPDQILYEQFLPSFAMAFKSGVRTVMVNSGEVNGEPVHGSKFYLDEILRKRMGFDGVVLTDIKDIDKIVVMHSGAATFKDAVLMALNAGIDMSMECSGYAFAPAVKELMKEGKVSEKRIDESVRRILKFKFALNLFEKPYPDEQMAREIGSKQHYEVAKKAAAESIVMLKNTGILPLKKGQKILLAGFAADSKKMMNGPWTLEWQGADEERQRSDVPTLFSALQKTLGKNNVILGSSTSLAQLQEQAKSADVIVLTIGEYPYSEFKGNITTLLLDEDQRQLVSAAQSTGKPVILLLVEGRPRIITEFEKQAAAVLFIGYPGQGGAEAIVDIFSGKVNPSGKLSFTYPSGPSYHSPYYSKPSEYHHASSQALPPLYPFGHGLSYTKFRYSALSISDTVIKSPTQAIKLNVQVSNTGQKDGKETVLWFVRDEVGSLTRPVKQLKGFTKKLIKSGSTSTYELTLLPQRDLSYPDKTGKTILENGYFQVLVGDLKVRFKLDMVQ